MTRSPEPVENLPWVSFVGGGPTNFVPAGYLLTYDSVFDAVQAQTRWGRWWEPGAFAECQIEYVFHDDTGHALSPGPEDGPQEALLAGADAQIVLLEEDSTLLVEVHRQVSTLTGTATEAVPAVDGGPNPLELAYADISAALTAITAHAHLPSHPGLPAFADVARSVASQLAERARSVDQARRLVRSVRPRLEDQTRDLVDDHLVNGWGVGQVSMSLAMAIAFDGLMLTPDEAAMLQELHDVEDDESD